MSDAEKARQHHVKRTAEIIRRIKNPETRAAAAKTTVGLADRLADPATANAAIEILETLAKVDLLDTGDLEAIIADWPSEPKLQ